MKTLRTLTIAIITVLVISAWAPMNAYAMSASGSPVAESHTTVNAGASQLGKLTVNNHTGGTLYVKLSGSTNYWFSASNQGKTVFNNIAPGNYKVVLSTSACSGSLTYKVKINKGGNANLKPVVCRK